MHMLITRHAEKRVRERLGICKRAVWRAAAKALNEGLTEDQCTGAMRKWLDKQALVYDRRMKWRLYAGCVWVFSQEDVLITVITMGRNMKKGLRPDWDLNGDNEMEDC